MNNRMKYRAWNIEEKQMYYDAEKAYDCMRGNPHILFECCFGDLLEDNEYEVMQCTGLKDKNNKDIYEGDVIHYKGNYAEKRNYVVFWDNMKAGFFIVLAEFYKDNIEHPSYLRREFINAKNKEIIGNIYDNPELLEEKE